jgi:hypothetical protein
MQKPKIKNKNNLKAQRNFIKGIYSTLALMKATEFE